MGLERHSSKSSQSSLSGLRTVTRDFSQNTSSSQSGVRHEPYDASISQAQAKATEAKRQRLKLIQDALAAASSSNSTTQPVNTQKPLSESRTFNKRPSDPSLPFGDFDATEPPVKKKRELPPGWKENEAKTSKGVVTSRLVPGMKSTIIQEIPEARADTRTKSGKVLLSQEQTQILELVESGKSLFYTGSAGTGKSVLLREIIKTLKRKFGKNSDVIAITASTGIAACNIGGVTIHSFAGIGLGAEGAKELASKVRKNKKASGRWARTKVLIVDEDGDLFDKLAEIGSILRKNTKPFGGIQLIVTGDFFQLPPVTKGSSGSVKFAFEAKFWPEIIERTFNLTKVFRQRDQEFVDMLNEMRFGKLSAKSIARFKQLSRPIEYDDGLGPTELFPRREEVDRSNGTRLLQLKDEADVMYKAVDSGAVEGEQRERLLSNFMAPKVLNLRLGAQVMLIKNVDENLVNGSTGRIVEFRYPGDIDDKDDPSSKSASSKGSSSTSKTTKQRYPVVEFLISGGGRAKVMVTPETFKVELPSGEVQASRTQVLNFDARKVEAHPKVVQWTRTLETIMCEEVEEDDASWTL
ncbi:hypothetical protein K435DRAFT_790078 [Dendrothele bispora CBS 962.96]|uniref:ATP-dependent DNA helicase n=1 Tax=Dendrothele bispora (strain CBS 962.96) TaxID=1314807 RepID=A0A4S8MRJ6_DENBC|nr:hypothetical protein K435DRAFT_790078 [Dendrothele bispora CBS 962.96]